MSDTGEITEEVMEHVCTEVSAGAVLAARELLNRGGGIGFASLEDTSTGKTTGAVLVTLDPENAEKVLEFARSLVGSREGRIS